MSELLQRQNEGGQEREIYSLRGALAGNCDRDTSIRLYPTGRSCTPSLRPGNLHGLLHYLEMLSGGRQRGQSSNGIRVQESRTTRILLCNGGIMGDTYPVQMASCRTRSSDRNSYHLLVGATEQYSGDCKITQEKMCLLVS